MKQFFIIIFLGGVGFLGFWTGSSGIHRKGLTKEIIQTIPVFKKHPFVVVVYGKDDSMWCEKTLRSIFEQEYENYRLIFIDDGSMDDTFERVHHFVEETRQEDRTILIQNAIPMGYSASIKRAAEQCFDQEIIFPLSARDWISHPNVLASLNQVFQKKGLGSLLTCSIQYPDYSIHFSEDGVGFASLFRNLDPKHSYLKALNKAKKQETVLDPVVFHNRTLVKRS